MKKFIVILTAFIMSMVNFAANAEETIDSTVSDNWFVGVNGGVSAPMLHSFDFANHSSWIQLYRPEVGVSVGKWFTPIIGVSINEELGINMTPSHTAFDVNTLTLNGHLNLSNLFGGYRGSPRTVEFELIPAIGWRHHFCQTDNRQSEDWVIWNNWYRTSFPTREHDEYIHHCNYVNYRLAASVDFNLGKQKAWQINVVPALNCFDRFRKHTSTFDFRVGVTYKIKGGHSKSYNFVLDDRDARITALLVEIDELGKIIPKEKEVVKTVVEERIIERTVMPHEFVVRFALSSSELTDEAKIMLNSIPTNVDVEVEGFASPDGDSATNYTLSLDRANAVKDYLLDRGVRVSSCVGRGSNGTDKNQRIAIVTIR